MLRLLHTADLHLDTPFTGSGLTRDQVIARRGELLSVFQELMRTAAARMVDLVLIAGDLFEEKNVIPATLDRVFAAIGELHPIPVLVSPGNHDPYHPGSPYATETLPKNLYLFRKNNIEKCEFTVLGVAVYGLAFRSSKENKELLRGFEVRSESPINILLCHGAAYESDAGLAADYLPIKLDDLRRCGADYCALGHYHKPIELRRDDGSLFAAYPGSPEPLRFGRTGEHGALIIEIDPNAKSVKADRLTMQRRRYHSISLDLSACEDIAAVDREINAALRDPGLDNGIVEMTVSGLLPPGIRVKPSDYSEATAKLFAFRFEDRTRPDYDLEAIASEQSSRGAFCRRMLDSMEKAAENERATAEQALRLGLAAFENQNVEEIPL
jgi:exonuclease SbcD